MILNGNDIKKLIEEKNVIENYNIENIQSASYDISISSQILKIKKSFKVIDLSNSEQVEKMYEKIDISDGYNLKSGECILLILNEKINMPENMVAHIRPRTSLSRLGLYINFQHINSGYKGILNIAVYNMSPNTYRITPNLRIGQIIFEEITEGITDELLYQNAKTSMYQNEDGTVGSKIYTDYVGKVFRHFTWCSICIGINERQRKPRAADRRRRRPRRRVVRLPPLCEHDVHAHESGRRLRPVPRRRPPRLHHRPPGRGRVVISCKTLEQDKQPNPTM